jgi:hypothetical protein
MFHQTKQYHVTDWFLHGFFVTGHLLYHYKNQSWQFVAIPQGGMMAIEEFKMSPMGGFEILYSLFPLSGISHAEYPAVSVIAKLSPDAQALS